MASGGHGGAGGEAMAPSQVIARRTHTRTGTRQASSSSRRAVAKAMEGRAGIQAVRECTVWKDHSLRACVEQSRTRGPTALRSIGAHWNLVVASRLAARSSARVAPHATESDADRLKKGGGAMSCVVLARSCGELGGRSCGGSELSNDAEAAIPGSSSRTPI